MYLFINTLNSIFTFLNFFTEKVPQKVSVAGLHYPFRHKPRIVNVVLLQPE